MRAPRPTPVAPPDACISNLLARAEQRMAASRGRLQQFRREVNHSLVPAVTVDNERRYVEANKATRLLFRMTLMQLRDAQIEDLTAPDYMVILRDAWSRLMLDGHMAGPYEARFFDGSCLRLFYRAVANVLPGQHLIVFAPAEWPEEELSVLEEPSARPAAGPLTAREREVLTLIALGADVQRVAAELTIASGTVKSHIRNIHRKLGSRNRPHAVALALQLGLIELRSAFALET